MKSECHICGYDRDNIAPVTVYECRACHVTPEDEDGETRAPYRISWADIALAAVFGFIIGAVSAFCVLSSLHTAL